jgi:hypothetical protein
MGLVRMVRNSEGWWYVLRRRDLISAFRTYHGVMVKSSEKTISVRQIWDSNRVPPECLDTVQGDQQENKLTVLNFVQRDIGSF